MTKITYVQKAVFKDVIIRWKMLLYLGNDIFLLQKMSGDMNLTPAKDYRSQFVGFNSKLKIVACGAYKYFFYYFFYIFPVNISTFFDVKLIRVPCMCTKNNPKKIHIKWKGEASLSILTKVLISTLIIILWRR